MPSSVGSTPIRPVSNKNHSTNTSANSRPQRPANENARPSTATSASVQKGLHGTLTQGPTTPTVTVRRGTLRPNTIATNAPPTGVDWTAVLEKVALLESEVAQAKAAGFGPTPCEQASSSPAPPEQHSADDNVAEQLQQTQASLAAAIQSNTELRQQLEAAQASQHPTGSDNSEDGSVLRPKGAAGVDFSIQVEMGLATSSKNCDIYKGTLRYLRDLAIRSGMNWELPWAEVPAEEKVKVYRIARKQHPYLRKYRNDWATEEIIKQFFKNKRKNYYRNGWLTVPDRFTHMSDVSSKRNPTAPRIKKAKQVLAKARARTRKAQTETGAKGQLVIGRNGEDEEEGDENDEESVGDGEELEGDDGGDMYA